MVSNGKRLGNGLARAGSTYYWLFGVWIGIAELQSERIDRRRSAFDGNRQIEHRRGPIAMKFTLDGVVDDLLHVRSATATPKAGSGRQGDFTRRRRALSYETANLSVGDSAAMANEHRRVPSFQAARILSVSKMKINVIFNELSTRNTIVSSPEITGDTTHAECSERAGTRDSPTGQSQDRGGSLACATPPTPSIRFTPNRTQ